MKVRIYLLLPILVLLISCQKASFRGTTQITPGICQSSEEYVGANFMFMIDNSGSMVEADCPSGDAADCGMTERERALLKAFDILTDATVSSELNEKAISSFSVAKFTPEDRSLSIDEFHEPVQLTLETVPENRDELAEVLRFNRRPEGDTPYLNALELGLRIQSTPQINHDLQKVLILVTDGEPTDRQPSMVREKAQEFDGKIVTIRVNYRDLNAEGRRSEHLRVMSENYPDWSLDQHPSIDAYVDDLLSLAGEISQDNVIEINSVNDLETKFFEDIIKKTVPCLPE
ncbi:MAG: vWA domain-containing protein [Oligoflexus sp.]